LVAFNPGPPAALAEVAGRRAADAGLTGSQSGPANRGLCWADRSRTAGSEIAVGGVLIVDATTNAEPASRNDLLPEYQFDPVNLSQ
jgi:hypothetical protein